IDRVLLGRSLLGVSRGVQQILKFTSRFVDFLSLEFHTERFAASERCEPVFDEIALVPEPEYERSDDTDFQKRYHGSHTRLLIVGADAPPPNVGLGGPAPRPPTKSERGAGAPARVLRRASNTVLRQ